MVACLPLFDGNGSSFRRMVLAGLFSHNAFEITPTGTITQIVDATGAGVGARLSGTSGIAIGSDGTVYVTGSDSNNAFRLSPPAVPGLHPVGRTLVVVLLSALAVLPMRAGSP